MTFPMLRLSRLPRVSLVSSSANWMTPLPVLEGELDNAWREESEIFFIFSLFK